MERLANDAINPELPACNRDPGVTVHLDFVWPQQAIVAPPVRHILIKEPSKLTVFHSHGSGPLSVNEGSPVPVRIQQSGRGPRVAGNGSRQFSRNSGGSRSAPRAADNDNCGPAGFGFFSESKSIHATTTGPVPEVRGNQDRAAAVRRVTLRGIE